MSRKGVLLGGLCPYCKEGRLFERPMNEFADGLDKSSEPLTKTKPDQKTFKAISCNSCGGEINFHDVEYMERLMKEENRAGFPFEKNKKSSIAG